MVTGCKNRSGFFIHSACGKDEILCLKTYGWAVIWDFKLLHPCLINRVNAKRKNEAFPELYRGIICATNCRHKCYFSWALSGFSSVWFWRFRPLFEKDLEHCKLRYASRLIPCVVTKVSNAVSACVAAKIEVLLENRDLSHSSHSALLQT